jgi:hypothetical protein
MHQSTKYKHSLISFLVLSVFTALAVIVLFPIGDSSFSESIKLFMLYLFIIILALAWGIGLVVSRTTDNPRVKSTFRYNFLGTLNLYIGISGLILATIKDFTGALLPIVLNLLLGILIYNDIYSKEEVSYR